MLGDRVVVAVVIWHYLVLADILVVEGRTALPRPKRISFNESSFACWAHVRRRGSLAGRYFNRKGGINVCDVRTTTSSTSLLTLIHDLHTITDDFIAILSRIIFYLPKYFFDKIWKRVLFYFDSKCFWRQHYKSTCSLWGARNTSSSLYYGPCKIDSLSFPPWRLWKDMLQLLNGDVITFWHERRRLVDGQQNRKSGSERHFIARDQINSHYSCTKERQKGRRRTRRFRSS